MKQPHEYNRRVLLCVIGMTPQIVTETLYKLAIDMEPAFIPTEIHLITTTEGASSARHALLGVEKGKGEFHNFCRDFAMEQINFTPEDIHIISGPGGLFIDDTQYSQHNETTADYITNTVRTFTDDDKCALHLSIAGGRKTMSYYAGYALSLYGRMQDRLSHVLVAKPFQENENFFYPPKEPKRIAIGNTYHSTDEANIILSDIPFVRLHRQIPKKLLAGKAGFRETVNMIQCLAEPPTIAINSKQKEVYLNTIKVEMDDASLAVYLWMCERKISGQPPLIPDSDVFFKDFLVVYKKIAGEMSGMVDRLKYKVDAWRKENKKNKPREWFQVQKSRLIKAIKNTLGDKAGQPFFIQTVEHMGQVAYAIELDTTNILLELQQVIITEGKQSST